MEVANQNVECQQDQTVKVSVIVPAHNVEQYFSKSLESILSQELKEIEIILVVNGCTDGTVAIAERYKKADVRIKVLLEGSIGAANARNIGLEAARGDYVMFLDSDDYFEQSMLKVMYEQAEKEKSDLVTCCYEAFVSNCGIAHELFTSKPLLPSGTYTPDMLKGKAISSITTVPWDKMIKRELLIKWNIRFQDIPCCDDIFFSKMVGLRSARTTVLPNVFVHYRIRQNGNLMDRTAQNPLCPIYAARELRKEINKDEEIRARLNHGEIEVLCVQHLLGALRYLAQANQLGIIIDSSYEEAEQYANSLRRDFDTDRSLYKLLDCGAAIRFIAINRLGVREYVECIARDLPKTRNVKQNYPRQIVDLARLCIKIVFSSKDCT